MLLSEHVYCVALTFKMTEPYSIQSASNFLLRLNIPPQKQFGWFRRLQFWAADDWQLPHDNVPTHASRLMQRFLQNIKSPRWFTPLQPRFGTTLQLLPFSKTKITFEREEISDCQWDSGKYDGAVDGNWKNCVRSQGAYFEGYWCVIVLCTVFLVSCIFFNKCLYFS